jgi:hypothetical protein
MLFELIRLSPQVSAGIKSEKKLLHFQVYLELGVLTEESGDGGPRTVNWNVRIFHDEITAWRYYRIISLELGVGMLLTVVGICDD